MIGEIINILMGFNAADNEAVHQRIAANQAYAEARNRAAREQAAWRCVNEGATIIEGTFTVVEEPKLLEGK